VTFFVEEEERKKTPRASFSSSTRRKVQEEMNKRLPYFRSSFKVKEIQSEVQRGSSENGKGRRKERNGLCFSDELELHSSFLASGSHIGGFNG